MCKVNNIESVDQIVCALKKKHKSQTVEYEFVILNSSEIGTNYEDSKEGVYFYGILSVGDETTVDLEIYGGSNFQVVANKQIIEMWESLSIDGGGDDAVSFRGYEITVK